MLMDLVLKNRSYRRFDGQHKISMAELIDIASLSRIVPSSRNLQPIKLMLINSTHENNLVFSTLNWAAQLKEWKGPSESERPTAYILLLNDLEIGQNFPIDDGIIAQTLMLGAVEKGYGGCILSNINRPLLAKSLNIDSTKYTIDLVLALGKPSEEIILEKLSPTGSTHYYRDAQDIHHVPKRSLNDLIVYKTADSN